MHKYVQKDKKLGDFRTDPENRIPRTWELTKESHRLLAHYWLMLNIALPQGMTIEQRVQLYDENYSCPTEQEFAQVKRDLDAIDEISSFEEWFRVRIIMKYHHPVSV